MWGQGIDAGSVMSWLRQSGSGIQTCSTKVLRGIALVKHAIYAMSKDLNGCVSQLMPHLQTPRYIPCET